MYVYTHTHTRTCTHTHTHTHRGFVNSYHSGAPFSDGKVCGLWFTGNTVYTVRCLNCFIFLTQLTNSPGYSDHSCTQSWSSPLPLGSGNYTTPKLLLLFLLQLSHMTIWGSILSWFVFLPIYAQVWYVYITTYSTPKILLTIVYRPTLPFGSEMTGLVRTNKTHVKYINYIFFYTYIPGLKIVWECCILCSHCTCSLYSTCTWYSIQNVSTCRILCIQYHITSLYCIVKSSI